MYIKEVQGLKDQNKVFLERIIQLGIDEDWFYCRNSLFIEEYELILESYLN